MTSLAARIEEKRVELDRLRTEASSFRGACANCRWFRSPEYHPDYCANPLLLDEQLDPISGCIRNVGDTARCRAARGPNGLCGKDGVLWEPRTARQRAVSALMWALVGAIGLLMLACIVGAATAPA